MNRTIRGMAGLLVALGASACANDYSLDFGGPPTQVQASPETMFITSGAAPKELLLRLVNDRNQSVPAEWTVTNVPAGLTVVKDENYRPDYINPDDELIPDALQVQHRYFVSADIPTGGQFTFTVSSQGISRQITVRVLPTTLGAALSAGTPALGEEVTITAPATMSFSDNSVVSFSPGGNAVITSRSPTSISFLPRPGSEGPATVTNVTLNYAPTLSPQTLTTTSTIMVPAVTNIPLAYSKTNLNGTETTQVTAAGFKFRPNVSFSFNGRNAFVLSVSADSNTATILPPPGLAGATAVASNVLLSFLTEVPISNVPSTAAITTGTYPTLAGTANPDGSAPVYAVPAPGTGTFIADAPSFTGADIIGGGGPLAWYKITVATAGTRAFVADWTVAGDIDAYIVNEAVTAFVNTQGGTANHPESFSQALAAATNYWVVGVLWTGPVPPEFLVTIK